MNITVSWALRDRLTELAHVRFTSPAEFADEVLEAPARRRFWSSVDEGYARLRQDPDAWAEYVNERNEWGDACLVDE